MTYARIPMTTRRRAAATAKGADPLRVVFCSRPAYGHVYPLLPLAMACRDAGHDVTFVTSDEFLLRLLRLGFPVHSAGISVGEAEQIARREHPQWVERHQMWNLAAVMFAACRNSRCLTVRTSS
jgi:UDP:flavonoid glycosyltransferase YjiC (YdhE family)